MESRIPLPTDNIYKFYALFGLLLFIFSIGAALYVGRSANEVIFDAVPKIAAIHDTNDPVRLALEKRVEIAASDRKFLIGVLGGLSGLAFLLMLYGFGAWHRRIQPLQDELAAVRLETAKLQLSVLRAEVDRVESLRRSNVAT